MLVLKKVAIAVSIVYLATTGANAVNAPVVQPAADILSKSLPVAPPRELTLEEKIVTVAKKYDVNPQIIRKTLVCESRLNEKAYNGSDPSGGAFGVAQFLKPTFYHYAKMIKIIDPDVWNTDQQLEVMAYMFSIGEAKQWTCARNLGID